MQKYLFISLISFASIAAQAMESIEQSYGTAKNSKGAVVYLEEHTSKLSNGVLQSLKTAYFLPKGGQFGFIHSDFSQSPYVPNYKFEDKRHSRFAGVTWATKTQDKQVLAYSKAGKDTKRKERKFKTKKNTVTGQGLHNFLRVHLSEFIKNNRLKKDIKFLIPMNQDQYKFRIRATNYNKTKNTMKLRIEADSWLFRMLAPHIDVTYDTKKNRLLKYEGPSNLLDQNGNNMNVTIGYKYEGA